MTKTKKVNLNDVVIVNVTEAIAEHAKKNRVQAEKQALVDEYIRLSEQASEIEKKRKEIQNELKPYMKDKKLEYITGSEGKRIRIEMANASTNEYNAYDTEAIRAAVTPQMFDLISDTVVSKSKVEQFIKNASEVDKTYVDILNNNKIINKYPKFMVRK